VTAPIIIFGGSFDPPTRAHQVLPMRAADLVSATRVIYVPASVSPHKVDSPPIAGEHRLAMLTLALDDLDRAEISTVELERKGPSFMVDTLRALRKEIEQEQPLRLLIGDDQAVAFHRWKEWDPIIDLAEPLVLPRLYATPESFAEALAQEEIWTPDDINYWLGWRLDLPIMDVEAAVIRAHLRRGEDISSLLPPAVLDYIVDKGLYVDTD